MNMYICECTRTHKMVDVGIKTIDHPRMINAACQSNTLLGHSNNSFFFQMCVSKSSKVTAKGSNRAPDFRAVLIRT